jgi:8-oxo-dGTP diphosphatase
LYCSQCGARIPDRDRSDQQPVVCPQCHHGFYHPLKVAVGVLAEREGALLLLQRDEGSEAVLSCWGLPAGPCAAGKASRVNAARQAAEETGFQVEVGRLVGAYHFHEEPWGSGLLLAYEGRVAGGRWRVDRSEPASAGFFAPEQIPKPLCGGGHDQAIEAWRRRREQWQPGTPMRFCPHCTHPLEERVAFDRLRSVCPACGFVDFRAPKVGVSALITEENGQLLLIRRAVPPGKGKWCLPSGFVEWDESPEQAVVRECAEETGLVVTEPWLFEVRYYSDDFRGPGINLTYRAEVAGGVLRAGDDAAEVRYFAPGELPAAEDLAFASHRSLLEPWRGS